MQKYKTSCCLSVSKARNNLDLQKPNAKVYFAVEKRTTLCEFRANVKRSFFNLIYHAFISIAHSCEINVRQ